MQRLTRNRVMCLAGLMMSCLSAAAGDELVTAFVTPPAEARPFVRWWWGENSVVEKEIIREIDVMDQAGIGGFEINPISLPVKMEVSSPSLQWLSPEFNRLVKVAVDTTRERGMIADLIVGSGWPFGAEFLKPGDMTKRLYLNSIEVQGPVTFTRPMAELKVPLKFNRSYKDALEPVCQFIYLAPVNINSISQSIDIRHQIKGGRLTVEVPAGKHVIHVGLVQEGFSEVHQGSPGAMGPVLDHYNAAALESFLNKMSDALGPVLGGKLGPAVRAIFCDSIELSAANWTADMRAVFKSQHGYDLVPYLPYMVDTTTPITGQDPWADQLKRVRYDYSKTLVHMFTERFIKVYHAWCHDNGCLSRYQAYGVPWLMGMLDAYLIPDIPETNNWFFTDPDSHGFLVWTKYCSSAGHIKGRRIISTEAMTNTRGVFQTTLDQIKAADDLNFVMGINHSVLHGLTYSPLEEGPYARVRYGAYFSEQNTWWPYFRQWADYNARLSAVFQVSKPVVSMAILGPRGDIWSRDGLERFPFHNEPWYLPQLWKVFSQCGTSADHVSEPILQAASSKGGKLQCGAMTYDVLLVAGVESLELETCASLLKLANSGVKIAFIDTTPVRGPSLNDLGQGDTQVKATIQRVLGESQNVFRVAAPDSKKPWEKTLLNWADALASTLKIERDITLDKLDSSFYQTRVRHGDRDIFFLINTDDARTLQLNAAFKSPGKAAWLWDPETGKRTLFASPVSGAIPITLAPHDSRLLVFEAGDTQKTAPPHKSPGAAVPLSGPWTCQFLPAQGKPFTIPGFALTDLGRSEDKALNTFAGVIEYSKAVRVDDATTVHTLDLGTVHGVSEVKVNGHRVGTRWYGQHVYDIGEAVKPGANEFVIKVTTVLHNHIRTLDKDSCAGFWTRPTRHAVPAGLVGPVQVIAGED
ncbi:MAG: hypothetical protein GY809_05705 [Planctomycetes bacterium]|nr:hypothetical protein [Planctomycetota bacterium]